MPPVRISDLLARLGRRPVGAIALEPHVHVEEIDLLGPEHAREGLALNQLLVVGGAAGVDGRVELVGLGPALLDDRRHGHERVGMELGGEPEAQVDALARRHHHPIVESGLGSELVGIRDVLAVDHMTVEGVLRIRRPAGSARPVDRLRVGLVVGEEGLGVVWPVQIAGAEPILKRQLLRRQHVAVVRGDTDEARTRGSGEDPRLGQRRRAPAPGVSKPEVGKNVERSFVRPPIVGAQADHDVLRVLLGVFDLDVEVPVVVEDAGVEKLVLGAFAVAGLVFANQLLIRESALGILVQPLHVRVARDVVEVEVVLLHILAVVAFPGDHAEQPLLENGIALVPECEGETQHLITVGDAGESVLAPPVGLRARMRVREVSPGVSVRRIVLAHRAPGALGDVGSPVAPGGETVLLSQALVFARHGGHSRRVYGNWLPSQG